jgi:hypothetical protein
VAFQLQSSAAVQDLFKMAMASETDDGTETLFWKDRWLNGQRLEDLAPHVSRLVSKRIVNRRTVADALDNTRWVQVYMTRSLGWLFRNYCSFGTCLRV